MQFQTPGAINPDAVAGIRQVLDAAKQHDLRSLRSLLRTNSASVQDPDTGYTPLHAAIAGAATSKDIPQTNGVVNGEDADGQVTDEHDGQEEAVSTVKLLLQNGAIWNDLDKNDETPGCLALRLGLKDLYDVMVDAGVRAEILLTRLNEYEQLKDDEVDEGQEEEPSIQTEVSGATAADTINDLSSSEIQPNQPSYLSSSLSFAPDRILDSSANGVMMSWETDLMSRTASLLAPTRGLRILNIGHGMGIIDSHFQSTAPSAHHIVEAHPAVLANMRAQGWYDKPNVVVHDGRWQDVLPKLIEPEDGEANMFDAIYFDTFAEPYSALRTFFEDFVIGLLDDGGKWGFFNGLGADRQICYDVYAKVVELDLFEAGFEVDWTSVEVPDLEDRGEWEGVKRSYFRPREYRLPTCRFMG